jgi:hypothetical protein
LPFLAVWDGKSSVLKAVTIGVVSLVGEFGLSVKVQVVVMLLLVSTQSQEVHSEVLALEQLWKELVVLEL